jgi:hypothetical protein
MDMARPELITSFGQIQLSYATALVNEPVPDSTEARVGTRQRHELVYVPGLAGVGISGGEPQSQPRSGGVNHF